MTKAEQALSDTFHRIHGTGATFEQVLAFLKECQAIKDHDIRKAAALYDVTERLAKGDQKMSSYYEVSDRWGVALITLRTWVGSI